MRSVRVFRVFRGPKPEGTGIMTENGKLSAEEPKGELLVYRSEDGQIKLKALEKQKRGLMQKLLTGEIRVK